MRKSSLFFIVVLSVLLTGCRKADKSIVIFFDNDVHCAVDGYPYFAGLRSAVDQDTAYVAMVSSGDYIQGGTIGSISRGEAIMSIIKEIGYDAMAMGNHEFDYDVSISRILQAIPMLLWYVLTSSIMKGKTYSHHIASVSMATERWDI